MVSMPFERVKQLGAPVDQALVKVSFHLELIIGDAVISIWKVWQRSEHFFDLVNKGGELVLVDVDHSHVIVLRDEEVADEVLLAE